MRQIIENEIISRLAEIGEYNAKSCAYSNRSFISVPWHDTIIILNKDDAVVVPGSWAKQQIEVSFSNPDFLDKIIEAWRDNVP